MEAAAQVIGRNIDADVDVHLELHPFEHQLFQPAVENLLFQLEIGNSVAKQPAQPVASLKHDNVVPLPGQLLRSGKPRGPRADDGHPLAGSRLGAKRLDPALGKCALDDPQLDILDVYRLAADRQRAGGLARRGANAAGNLGEVVGRVQVLGRLAPAMPVDKVVELRNAVPQRTADAVAERNAAIHAAGRLLGKRLVEQLAVDLVPIANPFLNRPMLDRDSRI